MLHSFLQKTCRCASGLILSQQGHLWQQHSSFSSPQPIQKQLLSSVASFSSSGFCSFFSSTFSLLRAPGPRAPGPRAPGPRAPGPRQSIVVRFACFTSGFSKHSLSEEALFFACVVSVFIVAIRCSFSRALFRVCYPFCSGVYGRFFLKKDM